MLQALDMQKTKLEERPAKRARFTLELTDSSAYNLTVAALLISLCPNITALRVYGVDSDTPLGQFFLKNNYGKLPKPALQKLKEVQFHAVNCMDERNYDYLTSLDCVRYFHRLPAINSLSFEGLEDYQADDILFPAKSSSGIKKIHIGHSDMTGEIISTIIRIPKALEEFSLSTYGLWSTDGGTSLRYPKTLGKSLLEHRDSLRQLELDAEVTPSRGDKDEHGRDEEDFNLYDGGEDERYAEEKGKWYFIQDMKDSDSASPLWAEDLPNTREYTSRSIGSMHDFSALTRLSIVSSPI
jgi:hypothetical protein